MSNLTTKDFFAQQNVKQRFEEILGKKSNAFITSVLQVATSNDLLAKADASSIYTAAMTAAVLDLPINQNLGFAYIVPFGGKAQFQIGYKGLIQLAMRSGQFETIAVTEIYDGQILSENPLTGYVFDFNKKSDKIIGYAAYFSLLNGFKKIVYWDKIKVETHAKTYSQTFKKGYGNWKDNFDAMAKKTVLKNLLSTYAPLSIDMQKAIIDDQKVDGVYADNDKHYNDFDSLIDTTVEDITNLKYNEDEQK